MDALGTRGMVIGSTPTEIVEGLTLRHGTEYLCQLWTNSDDMPDVNANPLLSVTETPSSDDAPNPETTKAAIRFEWVGTHELHSGAPSFRARARKGYDIWVWVDDSTGEQNSYYLSVTETL